MKTSVEKVTVRTKRAFAIARGSSDSFERVVLVLEEGGHTGLGEAAPTGYYGGDAETVAEASSAVEIRDPWDIEGTLRANEGLNPSALAALDAALHDLAAKRLGVPVYRLLGLARPEPQSAFTLGIADPETTVSEARRLSALPILKMSCWKEKSAAPTVTRPSSPGLISKLSTEKSPSGFPSIQPKLAWLTVLSFW